jgi:7,8-dihydropterin-6-yl-methyl-4-(beta-D-ribofuranosyl)aminobenzene 5'-phosphate synthase
LIDLLRCNPHVTIYVLESFPTSLKESAKTHGAQVIAMSNPFQLIGGVFSTGEMDGRIKEQALIVDMSDGIVIITGCAHFGVVHVARQANERFRKKISLLLGGFHLAGMDRTRLGGIIRSLKDSGVRRVAPSHCTGDRAMALFRQAWDENFVDGGLGSVIELRGSAIGFKK